VRAADFAGPVEIVSSTDLKKGDLVAVRSGELIPSDGEVILGAALVNESAITGESAPVVRESGGDRSAVTGGTTVIANEIILRITAQAGETFLDRMIAMIEGAQRRKTPNELALDILLFALTAVFLIVVAAMWPVTAYSAAAAGRGSAASLTVLIALFVCLAPTTIAALLPAIAIAGMDRLFQRNIIALSGRAIEAAGDANVLLLDKTGTITLGNREAVEFIPVDGVSLQDLVQAAYFASSADETPEGRSVVALSGKQGYLPTGIPEESVFIPFSAHTRFSGIDIGSVRYRKGAPDAIIAAVRSGGGVIPADLDAKVSRIAQSGGTPLVVSRDAQIFGVVYLKDILKSGIRERFFDLRRMGIRTIMITGDNRLTAASIAAEAGVDDFLAEAKPDDKLRLIREYQADGSMVAMTGDGTNDAPALAQADVAVAMNNGTQPAREAANIIDLDSNPTKLLDIVEIGKQILMTRGALTTFSIANDVAKYFAIIPAALAGIYPELGVLNVMGLATSYSAILSAVIFNAVVIPLLIPLALRGVQFRPMSAQRLLTTNIVIYGFGGVIAPFIGIKTIDLILSVVMPL
ncbi:MAG: potassium-transporting ATPase subunit KdpB, partial [Methanomicrobiales archaeon]|nr:potassium-transporting ATPase subunit KdpB [Methanomicrobiales archaeon]